MLKLKRKDSISLKAGKEQKRGQLLVALLLFFLINSLEMATNLLSMQLVDQALAGDFTAVRQSLSYFVLLTILIMPFDYLLIRCYGRYVKSVMFTMRSIFLEKLLKLDLLSFNQKGSSRFYSHISNDFNTIENNDVEAGYYLAVQIIRALTALIVLAYVNLRILLFLFLVMLVFFVVSSLLGRILRRHEKERTDLFQDYTRYIREIVTAFRLVKGNNLEERSRQEFAQKSGSVQSKGYMIDKLSSYIDFVQNLLFFTVIFGVLLLIAYFAGIGYVSAGYIVLVVNIISAISNPFSQALQKIPLLKAAQQIYQSIDESLEPLPKEVAESESFSGFTKEIKMVDVSFSYEDEPTLKDINLVFEKGKKYLLIGPSGGGKSTIIRLLHKYISPDKGEVLVDGVNLAQINSEDYLKYLANVEQHVFLFEDSLKNNLTLYNDYLQAEIDAAIAASGLDEFIKKQPQGLEEQILDNGKNISGGEKARIAIARALLRQSEIILLDEAFASLDDQIALAIEKRLLALQGVTVIMVSHVIFAESLKLYDHVYNIAGGKIS